MKKEDKQLIKPLKNEMFIVDSEASNIAEQKSDKRLVCMCNKNHFYICFCVVLPSYERVCICNRNHFIKI